MALNAMSPGLESRLEQLAATLGNFPLVDEIRALSERVHALKSSVAADEPSPPRQPATVDPKDWDSYEAECFAHVRSQRQRRLKEEAELQLREKQTRELLRLWTEFRRVAALPEPPAEAYAMINRRWHQQDQNMQQNEQSRGPGGDGREEKEEEAEEGAEEEAEEETEEETEEEGIEEDCTSSTTTGPSSSSADQTSGQAQPQELTFDNVWNDGNPKDMIITDNSNKFHVVRCQLGACSKHFGRDPLRGARTHLRQIHRKDFPSDFQYSNANALKVLGIGVAGCTSNLAEKNNAAFETSYNRRSQEPQKRPGKRPLPDDGNELPPAKAFRSGRQLKGAEDIEAGEVYCHEVPGTKCSAAIILPLFKDGSPEQAEVLSSATELGFFTREANAKDPVPRCIDYDEKKEVARGWKSEPGPGETEQEYPARLITGPNYPRHTVLRWVKRRHLHTYNPFFVNQQEKEHQGVEDYRQQMVEAEARAKHQDASRFSAHTTDKTASPEQWSIRDTARKLAHQALAGVLSESSDTARPREYVVPDEADPQSKATQRTQKQLDMADQATQRAPAVADRELSSGYRPQIRQETSVFLVAPENSDSHLSVPPCGREGFQTLPKVGPGSSPVKSFQAVNPGAPTEQHLRCATSPSGIEASEIRGYQAEPSSAAPQPASLSVGNFTPEKEPCGAIVHQETRNRSSTSEPYLQAPVANIGGTLEGKAMRYPPRSWIGENVPATPTPLSAASSIPGESSGGFQVPDPAASMSRSILCGPIPTIGKGMQGWAD